MTPGARGTPQRVCFLVVAKAPCPGQVKTRLSPPLTGEESAELAAAALLDTLHVVHAAAQTCGGRPVLALAGDLRGSVRGHELLDTLRRWSVVPQRGSGLAERLVNAHWDAAGDGPVVQVGMDTPQLTTADLGSAAAALRSAPSVLGPAADGGWWLLGLRRADSATVLSGVAMSTARTGALTHAALTAAGLAPAALRTLRDVDLVADVAAVADEAPGTRFSRAAGPILARLRDGVVSR